VTGPVHVIVWGGGRTLAPRAVLVHGTMTWGTDEHGFAAQRPLAEMAELWSSTGAASGRARTSTGATTSSTRWTSPASWRAGRISSGTRMAASLRCWPPRSRGCARRSRRRPRLDPTRPDCGPPRRRWGTPLLGGGRPAPAYGEADVLRVEGASHWPHAERPGVVNSALRRLWRRVAG